MNKAKILIVDDRPENIITLERLLDSPDLEVIKATSGEEALAQMLDHEFALVLLDVQMPGMDGYEVAELMRGNSKTSHIPIIFVTAELKNMTQVFRGYDSGAVDYLFKPLDKRIFTSKVNVFLELYRHRVELFEKTVLLDDKIEELEELKSQLEVANERLKLLSNQDSLTGVPNRRSFDMFLEEEWQRCLRGQTAVSVLMIDIDHFKLFNDAYGHVAGDSCLRKVAHALASALNRSVDKVARYGGEEFAAILPETDAYGARQVAERMQQCIAKLAIEHSQSPTHNLVTISIGIGSIIPDRNTDSYSLVELADAALYEAKAKGRHRIC